MKRREILLRAFEQAVTRCQADSVLADYLPSVSKRGRLIIIGAGKAAGHMAEAAERHYVGHAAGDKIQGLIVVPKGVDVSLDRLDLLRASHPIPDERSETAARRVLHVVRNLAVDHQVVMLLSAGRDIWLVLNHNWVDDSIEDRFLSTGTTAAAKIRFTFRY